MVKVFSQGGAVDEYVVEEDEDEAAQEGAENVVHQCLECCWGVAQPERHDEELIEPIMGSERHLFHISWVHANLMIARAEVSLGEEPGAIQLMQELVDH